MIQNFDLKSVTLEGSLRRQFDEVRDFYLAVPNDDFLKPYRMRAGLAAPGMDLGGLFVAHCPLPQMISGLARMYAATRDVRCREKAVALADGWSKCIAEDGFFYAGANPYIPPYPYDKWVGALVDLIVYADYPDAKKHLARITDWADKNLSRKRDYAQPQTVDGGEWYTLTENLLRAYMATGDARYRDFAETWEYTAFWKLIADGKNIFENMPKPAHYVPWYHAYSHVNSFNGLATSYLVKNDRWYLDTLVKAWELMQKEHLMVTGGYGQGECLVPLAEQVDRLGKTDMSFETQCGSWAAFKVSEYLTTLTGEAKYGDWVELLVINGIGASIPTSATGRPFYYAGYSTMGGGKVLCGEGWPCCSGTRPQAVTEYHDLIYYKDEDGLFINLYTASSVKWRGVTVEQITDFPESDTVKISVSCKKKVRFALRLRPPGWLASPMKATIDGKDQDLKKDSKGWAVIDREWSDGDKLVLTLPMGFRVSRPDPAREYPAAIAYGPVTLAVRYNKSNPARLFDVTKIADGLEPVSGETLTWRVKSHPDALLRPFYRFKEGERHFVYFDPAAKITSVYDFGDMNFGGGEWDDNGGWITSPTPGTWAEFKFSGDSLRIRGQRYDDAGMLALIVDGARVGTIDEYGPNRGEPASWEFRGLGDGEHTGRLEHINERSIESKGDFVNIAGFDCGF